MPELATHAWPAADGAAGDRTAVLVHGVTGWWRTWWRVGPALAARGWQVVAVDQRGHGTSPRIDGAVTVPDLAVDLATTIEGLGPPIGALIGHSLGAAVSAELAHARPELAARLLLEDPPAISRVGDMGWLANLELELEAAGLDMEGEVAREMAANPTWLEDDARQDVEGKRLADRTGIVASFRRGIGTRVLELAPLLEVPALYLLAAEGRSVFPAAARLALAATLPAHSRVRVVDAGHTIHRDRFEEYLAAVTPWVEER